MQSAHNLFRKKTHKHRLVVMGDSLSQGFNNGGIYRTDINFPSFLSRALAKNNDFQQPVFTAQAGIPLNLDVLVRGLSDEFGNTLKVSDYMRAATHLYTTLRRIKKYWEGGLKNLCVDRHCPYHNQAVWGFSVSDTWMVTEMKAREFIKTHKKTDFKLFDLLPDNAMYTTARLVLNPALGEKNAHQTMLDNVQSIQDDGGIENLIVCIGHNNIVGAATGLRFEWSEKDTLFTHPWERNYTVCRPEHFEILYRALAEKVSAIGAKRVFAPTLPHTTIPPVTRGVNPDKSNPIDGYFDYYTRFWVWDEDFDPEIHPHLTRQQAMLLDQTTEEFNSIIRKVAKEYGWVSVPVGRRVAAIAQRRHLGLPERPFPPAFLEALKRNPKTAYLMKEDGTTSLTTEYIRIDQKSGQIRKGGIFSLDGLHPSTIGYGLMGNVYYEVMKCAGVEFEFDYDWDHIIASDELITNPPPLLNDLRPLLRFLSAGKNERFFTLGKKLLNKSILGQWLEMFTNDQEKIKLKI